MTSPATFSIALVNEAATARLMAAGGAVAASDSGAEVIFTIVEVEVSKTLTFFASAALAVSAARLSASATRA